MKKILHFIICLSCLFVVSNAEAQVFYDVCSTGQLLRYSVISSGSVSVSAGADCELSGDMVIPSSVVYNGISYSVTKIPSYAFQGCSSLTSLTIPNSVTTIQSGAFAGCSGITSLTIPNSVTTIGESAFRGCSGLTSIVVDSSNPVYDSRDNCNAIIQTQYNSLVSGCQTTIIPNSVMTIGESAFRGCSGLTSLTIPNSVTSIGAAAFYGCSGLTSLTIPNSITSIGASAFSGCSGLTSLTISNSVATIGNFAFYGCSGLTSLTIPNSITSIGNSAFSRCSGLTSIVVDSDNPVYDSRDNCNAIIRTQNSALIWGCQTTVIPQFRHDN